MSQLNASNKSSLCHKNLYYPMPKIMYEKFVNKKWKERRDIFEDKKVFIARTNKVWKELSDAEKHVFMNAAPPPPTKNHTGFFFKSKTPKATPATVSAQTEIELSSSAAASSSTITTPTVNAHVAIKNRERFLNEKENDMLKKFITELKVSFEQLFTDDVRNDQNIMGFLKIFLSNGKFSRFSESSMKEVKREITGNLVLKESLEKLMKQ